MKRILPAVSASIALGLGSLVAPDAAAAACAPTLMSADAPAVKIGVHDIKTLTYTAYIDGAGCLALDDRVAVVIARSGVPTAEKSATYVGTNVDGLQVWQTSFTFDPVGTSGDVDLHYTDVANAAAGTWGSSVTFGTAAGDSGSLTGPSFYVQRYSRLDSLNASPEPVFAGSTETVTGKLVRANWDDNLYHGYATHPADLQFRTVTGLYGTLKTVNGDIYGQYRSTTTVDGCYRYYFNGTTTTPAVTSPGDCVDVQDIPSSALRLSFAYYNSPGTDDSSPGSLNAEYVTTKNTSTTSPNTLAGFRLSDIAGHVFSFPSLTLQPGASVRVHTGSGTNTSTDLYWGSGSYIWNNTGDTAYLRTAEGVTQDTCSWPDAGSYVTC